MSSGLCLCRKKRKTPVDGHHCADGFGDGAHHLVCGKAPDPVHREPRRLPGLGGRPRNLGTGSVCGHGDFPGPGGPDSRRAPGNCRRLRLRSLGGDAAVPAGGDPGQHPGLSAGPALGHPGSGAVLSPGENRVSEIHAEHAQGAGGCLSSDVHPRHAQGSGELLHGPDQNQAVGVDPPEHRRPDSLHCDLHRGRRRPGRPGLPVCRPGVRRHPGRRAHFGSLVYTVYTKRHKSKACLREKGTGGV